MIFILILAAIGFVIWLGKKRSRTLEQPAISPDINKFKYSGNVGNTVIHTDKEEPKRKKTISTYIPPTTSYDPPSYSPPSSSDWGGSSSGGGGSDFGGFSGGGGDSGGGGSSGDW